jgi:hypothetical protein
MTEKRKLGAEADKVFKDIREELASLLDNTIENAERKPSPDLWSDFSSGLGFSIETLQGLCDELEAISKRAYWLEVQETMESLSR